MEGDDRAAIDAELREAAHPCAVHEAGHAVVASSLGGRVKSVRLIIERYAGGSRRIKGAADCETHSEIDNLAVLVAGCRAEHQLREYTPRGTKKDDFRKMRAALLRFPRGQRRAARAEAYRLADEKLVARAIAVSRIADALTQKCDIWTRVVSIEGNELIALLDG